jgi:hypothetical protein
MMAKRTKKTNQAIKPRRIGAIEKPVDPDMKGRKRLRVSNARLPKVQKSLGCVVTAIGKVMAVIGAVDEEDEDDRMGCSGAGVPQFGQNFWLGLTRVLHSLHCMG